VDIFFPPGYDENPNLKYTVIYYLHGGGGDQNGMCGEFQYLVNMYIKGGIIDPVIMVGADNSPEPFEGSMYVNSIIWGNYEDYMVNDLIQWVDSSFHTLPNRNARAMIGNSMGGYGAFRYGILHKNKFCALATHGSALMSLDVDLWEPSRQQVILENQPGPPYFYDYATDGSFTQGTFLFSAAFSPNLNTPQTYIDPPIVDYLFDENAMIIDTILAKWQAFNLSQLIHQLSVADSVGIFFACGTNDNFLLHPLHLAFKDTLDLLGLPYEFYSHNGTHTMPNAFKQRALTFLDSLLMPPTPDTINKLVTHQKVQLDLKLFPNPFTNSTTIQFELFKSEYTELVIYNHLGQQVEILFKGIQKAGKLKMVFDASRLPTGIYFCQLRIGEKVVVKKIIKVR